MDTWRNAAPHVPPIPFMFVIDCFQTARYRHKIKLVEAMGDLIGVMGRLNLAPSPSAVLTVLEQALVVIGKSKTDLCNAR